MAKFETLFHYDSVSIGCSWEPNIRARFVAWIPGWFQICGSVDRPEHGGAAVAGGPDGVEEGSHQVA